MPPSNLQHRRTHNLLLISKLLNQRDAASPFTLCLDNLEQSAKPLVAEYLSRAKASKVRIIFVSFETLRRPKNVDVFVSAWSQTLGAWMKEVTGYSKTEPGQRNLIIIDSLNSLATSESGDLPALLSSFIGPTVSLLAFYHTDIPPVVSSLQSNSYAPSPLTLLKYLATTIFTTHSIHHVLARKAARDRSHAQPLFGLQEGIEGVIQGLGANARDGMVLEMEHRRKSGRGVKEWYYLPLQKESISASVPGTGKLREIVILLEDHPQYRPNGGTTSGAVEPDAQVESTFELGITDKQRRDREGVVLPYFDAQRGGGEGGRILYDMGSEDDFDEEEDEI